MLALLPYLLRSAPPVPISYLFCSFPQSLSSCLFIYIICFYAYFDNKYHLSPFSLIMLSFFQCTSVLLIFNLHVFLVLERIIQLFRYEILLHHMTYFMIRAHL